MFGIPLIIIISSVLLGIYFPTYGKEIPSNTDEIIIIRGIPNINSNDRD